MTNDKSSATGGTNEGEDGNALDMDAVEINKFAGESYEDGKKVTKEVKTGKEAPAKFQTPAQKAAAAAAETGAADEDDDDDDAPAVKQKPSKTVQQRIDIAVAKQRQAERDRDAATTKYSALEARLAALEKGKTPSQQQQSKVIDPDKEPDPENYDFGEADTKFIKDLARWEVKQELKADKNKDALAKQSDEQKAANDKAQKSLDKFFAAGSEKFGEDFQDKVTSEDIKISPMLAKLMLDSENGVDIAFDIASDAKLAKKVSAMSGDPARQAAWFGSYEDQHYSSDTADAEDEDEDEDETPPVKTSKPAVSRAPKPPAHKNRGGGSSESQSAATSDFAAFERMATKQR